MEKDMLQKKCKAVETALSDLTLTEKLRVIEKMGKKWRRQNSMEINEDVAQTRLSMTGKRIIDVDVINEGKDTK